jgi:uncharacterized membrane protein
MDIIGKILTIIWVLIVSFILYLKNDSLVTLSLNEWGDFLAGVTAPMAFLWLIIGYLLQRHELENNTEALRLQVKEMVETSEHHRESVALQKIELAHQYTMSLEVGNISIDNFEAGLMGLNILNNGQEKRDFNVKTEPDIGLHSTTDSSVFQANEGRRYHWILKPALGNLSRFVIEISYSDIEYLHRGKSYFTVIKTGKDQQYAITRGKYS